MNFVTPVIEWGPLLPIIVVLGAGAVAVLLEAFIRHPETRRNSQLGFSLVALLAAGGLLIWQWLDLSGPGVTVFANMITMDRQAILWQGLIVLFAVLGLLLFADRNRNHEDAFTPLGSAAVGSAEEDLAAKKGFQLTEAYPLLLLATGGMMLFTAVTDLIFLFVALEVFSLPLYILVALARRRRLLSQEAAVKYFLLGAFSSAIYLFGAALLYGATSTTSFAGLSRAFTILGGRDDLVLVGTVLVLVGLLFKLGAVPFHAWVPDSYQGAPLPVTAFMAAATKAAAVAALLRLSYTALYHYGWELEWLLWLVAIASIVIATVLALVQTDIKRMLAYSSIAHAGFIVVALVGFTPGALSALPFYLLVYGLASLGAFAVVGQVRELSRKGAVAGEANRLGQWAGLAQRDPFLAVAMAIFLFSFAGIPLTGGFIGKFVAFQAAVAGGAWILVLVAVLASAAAAFFYVRVIVLMFFTPPIADPQVEVTATRTPLARTVIGITAGATVLLGVLPGPVLALAERAAELFVTVF